MHEAWTYVLVTTRPEAATSGRSTPPRAGTSWPRYPMPTSATSGMPARAHTAWAPTHATETIRQRETRKWWTLRGRIWGIIRQGGAASTADFITVTLRERARERTGFLLSLSLLLHPNSGFKFVEYRFFKYLNLKCDVIFCCQFRIQVC